MTDMLTRHWNASVAARIALCRAISLPAREGAPLVPFAEGLCACAVCYLSVWQGAPGKDCQSGDEPRHGGVRRNVRRDTLAIARRLVANHLTQKPPVRAAFEVKLRTPSLNGDAGWPQIS